MSSIKIRLKQYQGTTLIRTLISHPMETGRRKDVQSGKIIPANYIQELTVEYDGNSIARCYLGPGISRDPYFSFRFRDGISGGRVTVRWTDNQGHTDSAHATIK